MAFYVSTVGRIGDEYVAVRLENPDAILDDPERYKWVTAVVSEDKIELIPVAQMGGVDGEALEETRSAVADFLAREESSDEDEAGRQYKVDKIIKQIQADKVRRASLLRRVDATAAFKENERRRLEQKARDLGCTYALASHIDWLERRLAALDGVTE